jgi:hypothetical protein
MGAAFLIRRKHCAICWPRLDGYSTAAFLYVSYDPPTAGLPLRSRLLGIMSLSRRIGFVSL